MKLSLAIAFCTLTSSVSAFAPSSSFTSGFRLQARDAATSSTTLSMMAVGDRRVVVTGMGITSCLGNTLDDVKQSLHDAKCGITFSEEYAELGIKSNVRGKPDLSDEDFKELIPKASFRFMGNNAKYAYVAMDRAIADSGLKPGL